MAGELIPIVTKNEKDCNDRAVWGLPSDLDQYIAKIHIEPEDKYPSDACVPHYYVRAKIDDFRITNDLEVNGDIGCDGSITASSVTCGGTKCFNISHPSPSKEGMRLVHACIEGPENGVYFRGRVRGKEINLPSYWKDLVDIQSITVSLTPVGAHQNVIVKRWDDEKIYLQSSGGMPIDCFYHVYGTRKDIIPLPVEMEKDEPWPYA